MKQKIKKSKQDKSKKEVYTVSKKTLVEAARILNIIYDLNLKYSDVVTT